MSALMAALTGCSVPRNGVTGISVDEAGRLTVVLAWCGRAPDLVIVYHDRAPGEKGGTADRPTVTDAAYDAPALPGQRASFRMDAPSDGWTAAPAPLVPDPAITYTVYGTTRDNSYSTRSVSFQADDAAKLTPGSVLVQGYDERTRTHPDVLLPLKEFEQELRDFKDCA
ncbi:hypothetical protein [Nonomuraea dietziae]|uniref:hypothetical protein n=1 Tax=Nonomuraea dietziae TaxID=65515 RepID=UPI00343707EA